MQQQDVIIVNKLGLHARAAAKLVNTAAAFAAEVMISRNGQTVNGKSIMGVMMLAATQGTTIHLQIDGADEEAAMQALTQLINERFGENE